MISDSDDNTLDEIYNNYQNYDYYINLSNDHFDYYMKK